ncbi:MAG: SRPBCC domain-containing protein [Robiginitomaculum sp.]|nr:SRPBCC domain-containing protein [Robiginitomaculum sp.]
MKNENKWVLIERVFDAPIETVWKMWTDPALFQKWYGPNGMKVPVVEMDVVVGGRRKICMEMVRPERTMIMWFTGQYKEVEEPTRLVYTESMSDQDGNIISPEAMGMPKGHPEVTEIIIELSKDNGKTRMKMVHIGVPADSGGAGGWTQAINKLAALVESVAD